LPQFLDAIRGSSIQVQDRPFTRKKRLHGHLIYERLDRAIGQQDWINIYPDAFVNLPVQITVMSIYIH